jgi:hypothetical protein
MHPEQALFLSFPFMVILHVSYDTTHTYSIQSGLIIKYHYIALGEGIICWEGVRGWPPPAPVEGMFCMNFILIGGQQARHTDKDRETQINI